MHYAKCHNVDILSPKKLLMLTSSIIFVISGRDTLRPLSIYFRPFTTSVCDTKYHKLCRVEAPITDHLRNIAPYLEMYEAVQNFPT